MIAIDSEETNMPRGVYVRGKFSQRDNNVGSLSKIFWGRVNKSGTIHPICGTCWEWIAGKYNTGYGQFRGKYAHRVAYELAVGKIPIGLLVLHRCDNKSCVNPEHLFIGTYQDNMNDKVAKGRCGDSGTKTPSHGSLNGRAKLTSEQVILARQKKREGWSYTRILIFLGSPVALTNLISAIDGKTWRSLPL